MRLHDSPSIDDACAAAAASNRPRQRGGKMALEPIADETLLPVSTFPVRNFFYI